MSRRCDRWLSSRWALPASRSSSSPPPWPPADLPLLSAPERACRGRPCEGSPLTSAFLAFPSSPFAALVPYGWDDVWADEFAPYATEGLLAGRVIRVDRGQCDVVTTDGVLRADTAFVTPNDPMRVVCTGDWVAVEPAGNPRYVRTYLPRRTAFVRSTSSKRSEGQILAANVAYAVVAVSLALE